ncbi:MAG: cyclic nucleotide-binding domain-containing protein [Thermodesulfobacteriota bacterium]
MDHLTDTHEYLNRLPIFSGAPAGVVKLFAYLAKEEEYPRRQLIVREGEVCDRCFLILAGKVEIFQFYGERRFHLQLLSVDKFNYFGELALLSEFKWFFSALALTDVHLLTISREAFAKVMDRYPEFYKTMVQKIVGLRIERFVDQTDYLMDNISPGAWREYAPESEWK